VKTRLWQYPFPIIARFEITSLDSPVRLSVYASLVESLVKPLWLDVPCRCRFEEGGMRGRDKAEPSVTADGFAV